MNSPVKYAVATLIAAMLAAVTTSAAQGAEASPLQRYRAYKDETPGDWRQINDTVARIGGWRAYSKESFDARRNEGLRKPAGTAP